jgi:hypothetical protein
MGLYWDTQAFYGCPVSPSVQKVRDRLKIKKLRKKFDCLMVDGACFVYLTRTRKTLYYKQSGLQLACARVKMSDLEECAVVHQSLTGEKLVKKEDFAATDEEKKSFAKMIVEFVKPENREEALVKTGYYMVETFFTTYSLGGKELIAARPIAVE